MTVVHCALHYTYSENDSHDSSTLYNNVPSFIVKFGHTRYYNNYLSAHNRPTGASAGDGLFRTTI